MFWSCPVFSDIGTTTKCSFSNFNNLIVKTIRSFALNFYEVIVDEADQNYIFTENWTGRRLLRTKFFICMKLWCYYILHYRIKVFAQFFLYSTVSLCCKICVSVNTDQLSHHRNRPHQLSPHRNWERII